MGRKATMTINTSHMLNIINAAVTDVGDKAACKAHFERINNITFPYSSTNIKDRTVEVADYRGTCKMMPSWLIRLKAKDFWDNLPASGATTVKSVFDDFNYTAIREKYRELYIRDLTDTSSRKHSFFIKPSDMNTMLNDADTDDKDGYSNQVPTGNNDPYKIDFADYRNDEDNPSTYVIYAKASVLYTMINNATPYSLDAKDALTLFLDFQGWSEMVEVYIRNAG